MCFEDHCEECRRELGKPYPEVHRWLDEFAGQKEYVMKHRKMRHHEEGIRRAADLFGAEAAAAARLHIISDLKKEGWVVGSHFPRDLSDYEQMGL